MLVASNPAPSAGRVLCLTASVGSGHTRAAQAVAAWTEQLARDGAMAIDSIRVRRFAFMPADGPRIVWPDEEPTALDGAKQDAAKPGQ